MRSATLVGEGPARAPPELPTVAKIGTGLLNVSLHAALVVTPAAWLAASISRHDPATVTVRTAWIATGLCCVASIGYWLPWYGGRRWLRALNAQLLTEADAS